VSGPLEAANPQNPREQVLLQTEESRNAEGEEQQGNATLSTYREDMVQMVF